MVKKKEDNPKGLYRKYKVEKLEGKTDPKAEYFVLRLDNGGKDKNHIKACREALLKYAALMKNHLPELYDDIVEKYG